MKTLHRLVLLFLPLLVLFLVQPSQGIRAHQISSTPTHDPFEEPPLPPDPTEFELGRNLYWHWCMTCHGDRGQGLTDEFRAIWEPEHQNCWGRGCHAGHPGDEGFPIPTIVPALVNETHLAQFASIQELSDFLKATHPPQSPGVLQSNEYHAIALFVFKLNNRPTIDMLFTLTPVPSPIVTPTLPQGAMGKTDVVPVVAVLIISIFAALTFVLIRRTQTLKRMG
jgi:hypothetical protein